MVDYIKWVVLGSKLISKTKKNSKLEFVRDIQYLVPNTGELKIKNVMKYKNMYFTFLENRLEIEGSLHKYMNDGLHNANDFSVDQCMDVIKSFCDEFGLPPICCIIIALEFGVNLKLSGDVNINNFLQALRFFRKNEFIRHHRLKHVFYAGSKYFELKGYNKSAQYPNITTDGVFRFEWKTSESKFLKTKNCNTLQDLLQPTMYKVFSKILLKSWDDVLVFDERNRKAKSFHHTEYWRNTISNMSANTFNNRKKSYYNIAGKKNIHTQVFHLLTKKIDELSDCDFSTGFKPFKYVFN